MLSLINSLGIGLYPALFVGVIAGGGFVLLPSIYAAIHGVLPMQNLIMVTLAANISAESFWYLIGMYADKERMYRLPFIRKRVEEAKHFSNYFSTHGVLLVFVSKFVAGTRIASHLLAGMHRISYFRYLAATTAGSMLWFLIYYVLLRVADESVKGVESVASHIQIVILGVMVVVVAVNILTGSVMRKKMMK